MKEGHNNRILIWVAVLILVVFGAYMFFFAEKPAEELLTVESQSTTGKEISELLITLKKINLAGGIFVNPTFVGLNNIGLGIVPFPKGRTNPFAPIGL